MVTKNECLRSRDSLDNQVNKLSWGRNAKELPADIILRLPVRFTFDNNYYDDKWQGTPYGGYTQIIDKLLEGIEIRLNTNFLLERNTFAETADHILFTGTIDSYYNYQYGPLEYRTLRFDTVDYPQQNYQGNALINYTGDDAAYTKVIEHKHFAQDNEKVQALPHTVITYEYPVAWVPAKEPYYPINDAINNALYVQYRQLAEKEEKVIFGGRLGRYYYLEMDDTVREALKLAREQP